MATQNNGGTANLRPFPKGVSGNPGGRPKGLARYVRELVGDDGRRIADFMLAVLDDETERTETRMQAATWLADRGFGKPPQTQAVELSAGDPWEVEGARERLAHKLRLTVGDLARYVADSDSDHSHSES